MDHFYQIAMVGPRTDPMLEAYTLLGGLAARTRTARLGALVTGVTYRNPALLAKEVTTLDIVSAGRAILGIGAAWNDDEHAGYGFGFPPVSERFERLEEALAICRAMFNGEEPTFAGTLLPHRGGAQPPPSGAVRGHPDPRGRERRAQDPAARGRVRAMPATSSATWRRSATSSRCSTATALTSVATRPRSPRPVWAGWSSPTPAPRPSARSVAIAEARGVDPAFYAGYAMAGDPDAICEQVADFLDAGLDGLIFNMDDAQDLEPVRLAGKTLCAPPSAEGTRPRSPSGRHPAQADQAPGELDLAHVAQAVLVDPALGGVEEGDALGTGHPGAEGGGDLLGEGSGHHDPRELGRVEPVQPLRSGRTRRAGTP